MQELTDEQISKICSNAIRNAEPLFNWSLDFARAIIAADRELQAARHAEELEAYALTVANLRAQPERKPLDFNKMDQIVRAAQIAFCLDKVDSAEVAIIRAVEAHHGIVPQEDK